MKKVHIFLFLILCFLPSQDLLCCSVPVFRYALEHWSHDPYILFIVSEKKLDDKEKKLIAELQNFVDTGSLEVVKIDIKRNKLDEFIPILKQAEGKKLPYFFLCHVNMFKNFILEGKFNKENLQVLKDMAIRGKIAKHLFEGDTVVWLFIKGSDKGKNSKALADLKKYLEKAEKEIKLPHELDENDTEYEGEMNYDIDLKVAFSIVQAERDLPETKLLINSIKPLMEEEIKDDSSPIIIPIFGRGRAVAAIFGKDITQNDVMNICEFLAGPCSCQIKAQNPGIDLFIPVDWQGVIEGDIEMNEAIPELTVPVISPVVKKKSIPSSKSTPSEKGVVLFIKQNLILTLIGGFAVIVLLTAILLKGKNKK